MNDAIQNIRQKFVLLFIFGIAMGFLEGIVVVYLRQVHYPQGFDFPLTLLSPGMLKVEWTREIATIVMLVSIAWLAGRDLLQRFSFFLFTFAVWDIIYYVALKLILDWPSSLMTWDILFLIPVTWIGPVLAPVIISLTMIAMGFIFTFLPAKGHTLVLQPLHWILIISGSAILVWSFIRDYLKLIISTARQYNMEPRAGKDELMRLMTGYVPTEYSWLLFVAGELVILFAVSHVLIKSTMHDN